MNMRRSTISLFLILSLLTLTACSAKEKVSVGDDTFLGSQTLKQVFPSKEGVTTEQHGKELWFAIGPMGGVGETIANGVTQAHFMEDGTFIHTVQLNIERAPEGYFYEGWLKNPKTGALQSTGHFRTPFGDVRHSLKFLRKMDLRTSSLVQVSLEADDGNPVQGKVVAEGTLKERKR